MKIRLRILMAAAVVGLLVPAWAMAQRTVPKEVYGTDVPVEVKRLIEDLYATDAAQQKQAVEKIVGMGAAGGPAIPYLILIQGEGIDEEVSRAALDAVLKFADAAAVPLLEGLKNEKSAVRSKAIEALGQIKDARAVEPLMGLVLDDPNGTNRRDAADVLRVLAQSAAVDALLPKLADEKTPPAVRSRVAKALGRLGDRRAVEPLATVLGNAALDPPLRCAAAGALGQMGDPAAAGALLAAAKDKNADVRVWSVWALGGSSDARTVDTLLAALKDADPRVRARAADSLGLSQDSKAVQPLIGALKDPDSQVRIWAALGLGGLGDARAVDPLCQALADGDIEVKLRAAEALGKLASDRLHSDADRSQVQAALVPLVGVLQDRQANAAVRGAAARAVGEIGDPLAVPVLAAALMDDDATVRAWTAEALGQIGDASAVEFLIGALSDRDATVRGWSATALGRIGNPRAVESLKTALADPDRRVQAKAQAALDAIEKK